MEKLRTRGDKIVAPAKFKDCPVFVPVFWKLAKNGFADSEEVQENTAYSIFDIKEDDVNDWPNLAGVVQLTIWEDEQEVVHFSTAS